MRTKRLKVMSGYISLLARIVSPCVMVSSVRSSDRCFATKRLLAALCSKPALVGTDRRREVLRS